MTDVVIVSAARTAIGSFGKGLASVPRRFWWTGRAPPNWGPGHPVHRRRTWDRPAARAGL